MEFKGVKTIYAFLLTRSTFYSWVSQLCKNRTSVKDKPRPERPAEAVTPTMVANVEYHHISFYTKKRCEQGKCSVGAEDKKAPRMAIVKEHLGRFNHDENKWTVLNCIWTVLSLGMGCEFTMLNLKQKLSQSSGSELVSHLPRSLTCLQLQGYASCL